MATATVETVVRAKAELRELMERVRAIEAQLEQAVASLGAPGLGGLRERLVDADGFPRADIDVHGTRTLRNQHARLNTDHKALMAEVERKMAAFYALPAELRAAGAAPRGQPSAPEAKAPPPAGDTPPRQPAPPAGEASGSGWGDSEMRAPGEEEDDAEPFALVDEVAAGGPAEQSGLRVGDALLRFGHVHAQTPEALGAVARCVGAAEAACAGIALLVRRRGGAGGRSELARLELAPRRWAGRGLLGCHLAPVAAPELTQ